MNYSPVKIRARVSSLLLSDCNYFDINPGKIFKWKKTKEEVDTTFQIQIDTNSKEENETIYLVKPGYLDLNSSLITNMSDMLSLYSLIFIVAFALFLASVLLFYFFDWRPFQNNLDSTVKYI